MSTLKTTTYTMPAAPLGARNPLPDLRDAPDAHAEIAIDKATVTPEEARYMGWARVGSMLPYQAQDGYGRRLRRKAFKAFELENEHLRATFLPSLGGRLWSLFDKDAGRELLHVNPVFRPCNLGIRNAWISGGVEWNCGIIGHTPFTVDDMACQRLALSDGTPVLRMFQYERVRGLLYRVEAFLPDGAKTLYVRVRIDNTAAEETAVYWWSNMAVDEREDMRVVVPADKAFRYGYGGKLAKVPVPIMRAEADKLRGGAARLARAAGGTLEMDVSRPTQIPQSMDFFFDVPDGARPFIAAPGGDGYGVFETSTRELRGRKLFVWGMGEGGRHWQSFLSKPGSAYVELQCGLARTQLEHLPMPGGATLSWLEAYGAVQADADAAFDGDWSRAISSVAGAIEAVCPESALEALHARVRTELDAQNGAVLHRADGFARVEKALRGNAFDTRGLSLAAMRVGKQEKPWLTLARTGALPCGDPLDAPVSYQIGAQWERLLTDSIRAGKSDHWHGQYQLGVMLAHRGADTAAREAFERSYASAENPWALAGLAALDLRAGNAASAADRYCRAAEMLPSRALILAALAALSASGQYARQSAVIAALPPALRALGRVKTYAIEALMRTGYAEEAERMLAGPIVLTDVREGDVLLTDLWYECMARKLRGSADDAALAWARETLRPPKHLDFRML